MRSYIKAGYGRHDLLQLAFFIGVNRERNGYKDINKKKIDKKVGNMTVREIKKLTKNTVLDVVDPDYGLELRP